MSLPSNSLATNSERRETCNDGLLKSSLCRLLRADNTLHCCIFWGWSVIAQDRDCILYNCSPSIHLASAALLMHLQNVCHLSLPSHLLVPYLSQRLWHPRHR